MTRVSLRRILLVLAVLGALAGQHASQAATPQDADIDPYFVESSQVSTKTAPQVITRNILQDRNGGYWLATWSGLIRYDGTTFTNVTNEAGLRRYRVSRIPGR